MGLKSGAGVTAAWGGVCSGSGDDCEVSAMSLWFEEISGAGDGGDSSCIVVASKRTMFSAETV